VSGRSTPTGITPQGTQQIEDWFAGFWAAFPDLAVSELRACDAGGRVIATLALSGTNTGPLGPLPATGRRATIRVCDIFGYDDHDTVVTGETFYEQHSLPGQLGHA
jgi:hypothetical protein